MNSFFLKTRIVSGPGSLGALAEFGAKKIMVVTDPYFAADGTAQRIAQSAGAAEIRLFDKVQPDPSVELAAEGTAMFQAFQPELLAALGGGSAMDLAKAIKYFSRSHVPLAAIPTTSGSGSEVTEFAVLTHGGVKHPLVDADLQPELAILDSNLLGTLPKALIADTGFDVLTHAAEAAVAKNAGSFSDLFARQAFQWAYGALPASFAGHTEVRLKIHQASAMAGIAFSQAGLGLCHALAHSLGGRFHVPHGRLNAILLPSVIRCNALVASKRYAELARAAGIVGSADSVAVRNLQNGLIRLRKELQLPETLAQAGIPPREVWSHMDSLVKAALADPCCRTNPLEPEAFVVRRILDEAAGRE